MQKPVLTVLAFKGKHYWKPLFKQIYHLLQITKRHSSQKVLSGLVGLRNLGNTVRRFFSYFIDFFSVHY